ncbi:MAG: ABC transporter substrate-binding protein, partial [Candidatus Velthaea sp.]
MTRARGMAAVFAAAFAAAALFAVSYAGGAADPVTTIRVGATGNDAAAEVYYADELGLFKKRNLVVQIQNLRNGAAEAAAVAGGALDIGEQNIVSMSNAHARGLTFKFLAPAATYVSSASTTNLLVGKDSPMKTARDLSGKTVAVSALGDLSQIAAQAWIDKNGGDSASVHF